MAKITSVSTGINILDFWSNSQEEVQLTGTVGNKTLPSITVADLPSGATIVRAIVMFKFRMVENTHATLANKLDGTTVASTSQVIQIRDDTPGTYYDCINFIDDQFHIAATLRESGDITVGNIDVSGTGKVDGNDTYNLQWIQGLADEDDIQFNDVQCGLKIWYSI